MVRKFGLSAVALLSIACISNLASAASLAAPGVYYGTGNEGTNYNWTVIPGSPSYGNPELGLRAIQRQDPTPLLTLGNTYFAPIGAQPGAPTYAAWNWDFSINAEGLSLSTYKYLLTISDTHGNTKSFDPTLIPNDHPTPAVGVQNSENPKFTSIFSPNYNMNNADIYSIRLDATNYAGFTISDQIYVNVSADPVASAAAAAVPVPAAAWAGMSTLAALGIFGWAKRKLSA